MGVSSTQKTKKILGKHQNLDSIDFKKINELPNDQYTCSECNLVPKILNIYYNTSEIEFKCSTHGIIKLPLKEYFIKESEYLYYNYKCDICKKKQNFFPKILFKFCYICNKIICDECSLDHNHLDILIPVNEMNNNYKGQYHPNHCNIYVINCKDNFNNKKIVNTCSDKEKEFISKFNPKPEDIEFIKQKNIFLKKKIEELE